MTKWRIPSTIFACATMLLSAESSAAELVVPGDYSSIRAAVKAASPGDTIKVHPGLYKEQVTINKNLTLKAVADDVGETVIQVPSDFRPFAKNVISKLPLAAVLRITDGAIVEISGFTVTGPIDCGIQGIGIAVVKNAELKITDSHVTLFRPKSTKCDPSQASGRGIFVGLPAFVRIKGESKGGSVGDATIRRLVIDKYHAGGVVVAAPSSESPSTAVITDSEITGGAEIPVNGQIGINVSWGIVNIKRNIIRKNFCTGSLCGPDPFEDFQSAGVGAPFFGSKLTEISDNIISDTDVGVYGGGQGDETYTISRNRISSRLFGIAIQDGKAKTVENRIIGGKIGIGVFAGEANAVGILKGDRIRRTKDEDVKAVTCCSFKAKVIQRGNGP